MTGQRPIIFYTNGYELWLWDDAQYPPRPVQGFYNKDELQLMINRRTSRKDITTANVNRIDRRPLLPRRSRQADHGERTSKDNRREALIVMATGNGKTRLSIATVEILMKHNWVRRVLFLADRTALLNQAKRDFNKLLPHATLANLVEEKDDRGCAGHLFDLSRR